jgi:O-antigen/teichoic acid export membrane protein
MKNSELLKNSTYSMLQTVVMSLAALFLFKLMVGYAGLRETGLWSFLSSITTITGFGSFGFANALLYFIPQYRLAPDSAKGMGRLINTGLVSVAATTLLLCIAAYLIFRIVIPVTVEGDLIGKGLEMLPPVIGAFFVSGLATTYMTVLDGLQLMHIRARIQMLGSVIFLLLGWIFLSRWGIAGVPLAQLAQQIFLLLAGLLFTQKKISGYRPVLQFDRSVFKTIFGYGFNFQVISVTQVISDPFMKSMLTRFAGSRYTAMFDFSVKLLSFIRVLLISANQTIVPKVTEFKTLNKSNRIITFYKANFRVISLLSILLFLLPVALSDSISLIFLNETSNDFNFILLQVALGLMVNALAFPAHFHYMGKGELRWNVINNLVAALIILTVTPLLGITLGGKYIILSWSLAAVTGSVILLLAFKRENGIALRPFIDRQLIGLLAGMAAAAVINHAIMQRTTLAGKPLAGFLTGIAVLALCLAYPLWKSASIKKMVRKLLGR